MKARLATFEDRNLRCAIYWAIVIFIVILDQATKAAAREVLVGGPRVLLPGIVNLVHVENTGAAFSLAEGAGVILGILAVVFLVGATLAAWRMGDLPRCVVVSIAMVAGGGFGNLIDRVMHGSVTDFISCAFVNFPVFNVADICITLGVVVFLLGCFVWEPSDGTEAEAELGNV